MKEILKIKKMNCTEVCTDIFDLQHSKSEKTSKYALELLIPRDSWSPKKIKTSRGFVTIFWFNVSLK